ncbi:iron uptake porin [Synechocystis sp. PCC 7509]|uniref:iron uptake porin n=1 Tax=Synechocystis sp. PCC 7509 TaxID=927677 RepID=UPI0002ABE375|nr:iron uptake porin [Synechocystis sp. PCC 7509]
MNSNLLSCSSKLALLCLLSGFLSSVVTPAKASSLELLSEQIDGDRPIDTANKPKNEPIVLSQSMEQVTSVSQLSDVQPTDWAFQALQSLVERYGCIAGYPDGTYRGNRALTRYEFAAGLNACLDRVNELIATATSDLAKREDLTTIERLQTEFASELAALRGRVDSLEANTAELEANQFSTTTKLSGEVIVAAIGATGGANDSDPNIILANRTRINLTSSFTGKDALITGLQAYNLLGGDNSTGGALGLADGLGLSSSSAKLSFEPQFPGVNPQNLSAIDANSFSLYKLLYVFPVASKVTLFAGTAAETTDAFPAITPFAGEGQEAISRFAGYNPVVRVSGGSSGSGLASAGGFIWNISEAINLTALYGSVNAAIPGKAPDILPGVSGTPLGAGLFSGSTVAAAQLTIRPSKSIDIGLNYANSYHEINILGTGLVNADIGALGGLAAGTPVKLNSVGGTLTWRFAPKVAISGYGAAIFVDAASGAVDASSTFTSWMVGLHFRDLFAEGNNAGLLFGQPLYRSSASGDAVTSLPGQERATPYHLEGYYRFRVNDHISVTPGAFVLFNPESNSNNETTVVGLLRTTFTF